MMYEVFDKLRSLQEILSRKFEIEKEINDIPKTLTTKVEILNRLKKSYLDKNSRLEETKKRTQQLRQKLLDAEQQRERYEKQMDEIKTQREYEALDKEIKDAIEKEQRFRKEILKEEKEIEELTESIESDEDMIKQQEEELRNEREKIKNESEIKQELLNQLNDEEQEIIPGLDREILFKFERIIRSKSGRGIVPIRGSVCTGCYMIIPAQFVNDVRAGKNILFCPYCSRILFYQEEEIAADFFQEEDAGSLADLADIDLDNENE